MSFDELVQAAGQVIDAAGVLAVLVGSIVVTVQALTRLVRREPEVYVGFRRGLGRSILLGELFVELLAGLRTRRRPRSPRPSPRS